MKKNLILFTAIASIASSSVFANEGHYGDHKKHEEMMKVRNENFDKSDENKDGKLTKQEHVKFHEMMMNEMKAKMHTAEEMFTKIDKNKDGFVTKEEFEKKHADSEMKHKGKK